MGSNEPERVIEHQSHLDLSTHCASKTGESPAEPRRELARAAAMPLPPSSPANPSQATPRLRIEPSPSRSPAQSPVQRQPSTRPLNPPRRSSTPLQTIRKSPSHSSPIFRRTSSNLLPLSPSPTAVNRSASSSTASIPENKPSLTAASVAQDFFTKELSAHQDDKTSTRTVVILGDSCYGHRYSRPRTSKAALGTIVERPERLHACVVGASIAYVRIGGRHLGGKSPPRPTREVTQPPFKILKTTRSIPLNSSAVTLVHGQKWMEELQLMCDSAEGKLAMNGKELLRPIGYGKDETGAALPKLHEGDLYLCSESLDALQGCLGGVCEAVDTVFGPGDTQRAFVCIRPPGHHCSSNFPSGFCWLNNVHVGIAHAAITHGLTHAAIIDFDLHHGDGSQSVTWDHNHRATGYLPKNASPYSKTSIGYFSLHDINSYPCEWGDEDKIKNASLCLENAHGQSIWNVHLEPWKNHTDFWRLYESRYRILLEKARVFFRDHKAKLEETNGGPRAKAAIFLSAGFDASEWEGSGMQRHKVNVPTDFYARFTADVVELAEEEGLGVEGRIISVLEGGYSDRALTSGVLSHLCGLTHDDSHTASKSGNVEVGLGSTMAKGMATSDFLKGAQQDSATVSSYHPDWWSASNLEALEALVNPAPTASANPREKATGNYSSPTQASTAKMTEPARERRSLSGQLEAKMSLDPEPVLPPPDVDWTVASYELSRLLIPTDRQTLSCRHDELNAEATKIRRERQSAVGMPSQIIPSSGPDQKMQLRDRKTKALGSVGASTAASRADRRRTIASVGDLTETDLSQDGVDAGDATCVHNRPRRRSSAASSLLSAFDGMNLHDQVHSIVDSNAGNARIDARAPTVLAKQTKAPVRRPKQAVTNKGQPTKAKASSKSAATTPTVPKIPSGFKEKADGKEPRASSDEAQSSIKSDESVKSKSDARDEDTVDALAAGMTKMKINLKVPSPEENALRQGRAAEGKELQKKTRAPKKQTVPRAAKMAPARKGIKSPIQEASERSKKPSDSTGEPVNDRSAELTSPTALLKAESPSTQHSQQVASKDDLDASADNPFVGSPVQAIIPAAVSPPIGSEKGSSVEGSHRPPATVSATEHQNPGTSSDSIPSSPLLPLSPDHSKPGGSTIPESLVSTLPTIKRSKADLPLFTASSPIPFAKASVTVPSSLSGQSHAGSDEAKNGGEADAHPEDEQKQQQLPIDSTTTNTIIEAPFPPTQEAISNGAQKSSETSIWEVPATPRQ